jgi:hypothetical protein
VGEHEVFVEVDAKAIVEEQDETNNSSEPLTYEVVAGEEPVPEEPPEGEVADLKVFVLDKKVADGRAQLVVKICNDGAAPASAFAVGIYLGGAPACGDTPVDGGSFPGGLEPHRCESKQSGVLSFSPDTATAWVIADYRCEIEELDEDNNAVEVLLEEEEPGSPSGSSPSTSSGGSSSGASPAAAGNPNKNPQPTEQGGCSIARAAESQIPNPDGGFLLPLLLALSLARVRNRRRG